MNLDQKWSEELTVERFRELLGVEPGRLEKFKHLNERAIQPAVAEINLLCDFGCAVEPVLAGRKVVKLKLSWWRKSADELKAAYRELQASKVGRKARLEGTVEKVGPAHEPIPQIRHTTAVEPDPEPVEQSDDAPGDDVVDYRDITSIRRLYELAMIRNPVRIAFPDGIKRSCGTRRAENITGVAAHCLLYRPHRLTTPAERAFSSATRRTNPLGCRPPAPAVVHACTRYFPQAGCFR